VRSNIYIYILGAWSAEWGRWGGFLTEEIAGAGEGEGPDDGAEDVVEGEGAVLHRAHPCVCLFVCE
jgi:hypothetical protein